MIEIIDQPIDASALLEHVTDPTCGAQVLFVGTTRQFTRQTDGQTLETEFLYYEAYREMAMEQMVRMEATARERWPVQKVAMVHRLGKVNPAESSVAVAVSCPHRSEAFEAARWLIDTLKHEVPIWKQEHYVQNGPEWIHPTAGNCRCGTSDSGVSTRPHSCDSDLEGADLEGADHNRAESQLLESKIARAEVDSPSP